MTLVETSRRLAQQASKLEFSRPVTHVYNPLAYARAAHETYLKRFGLPGPEAVLLGMNPGPFGMVQTGVPFGDVEMVRDWLDIEKKIGRPECQHPKRPVTGFACRRSEVSGSRLWSWARDNFGTPERFFARFFVLNYCPLCFMEESGRNRTPDKLPAGERRSLFEICDRALGEAVAALDPEIVVGIGAFARKRAEKALSGTGMRIGQILHPSPASPLANRGWAAQATRQLAELGIEIDRA